MIIGATTMRFAIFVSDTLATLPHGGTAQVPGLNIHLAPGTKVVGYEKLSLSDDATGVFGIAGDANEHTYIAAAKAAEGKAADDIAFEWARSRFDLDRFVALPDDTEPSSNDYLHAAMPSGSS